VLKPQHLLGIEQAAPDLTAIGAIFAESQASHRSESVRLTRFKSEIGTPWTNSATSSRSLHSRSNTTGT